MCVQSSVCNAGGNCCLIPAALRPNISALVLPKSAKPDSHSQAWQRMSCRVLKRLLMAIGFAWEI